MNDKNKIEVESRIDQSSQFELLVSLRPLLYKIHNEDCRETLAKLPAECIDLVVTSPPYDDLRKYKGYEFNFEVFTEIANELFRVMKAGGVIVWVVNDATRNGTETGTSFRQALYFKENCGFNLHDTMIWRRSTIPQTGNRYEPQFEYMFVISKGTPKTFNPIRVPKLYDDKREFKNGHRDADGNFMQLKVGKDNTKIDYNVWDIPVGGGLVTKDKIAHEHPAIFPETLAERHIISWSNEGDIIYDPFSGSGTTCKIADRLGRVWFGSEIAEEYCSVALRRIENDLFTKASN